MRQEILNAAAADRNQGPDANIPQREAATPDLDVWVSASAGSGKTKVLTDRVLRLLLPDPAGRWAGARPHKILCLTFTKAAAALMALRVQKRLGAWVMMDEVELTKDLTDLLGERPNPEIISAARKLFTEVLDVPNGLAIMTIHAFCQSTLGRFPVEAGISPGFNVLDDFQSHEILRVVVDELIHETQLLHNSDLKSSLDRLATYLDLKDLRDELLKVISDPLKVQSFVGTKNSYSSLYQRLLQGLGQEESATPQTIRGQFLSRIDNESLKNLAQFLSDSRTKTGQELSHNISMWVTLTDQEKFQLYADYEQYFLKKDFTPRSILAEIKKNRPDLETFMVGEAARILETRDKIAAVVQARQTADLIFFASACLERYQRRKRALNALDFGDLIIKTRDLLRTQGLEWVQYKLDEGIDHILVDEAQDTNQLQWDIVAELSAEFLSGSGREVDRRRSLFVVGDEKQSIFSFHGADAAAFQRMRHYFAERSLEAHRDFREIPLQTSFRSTPVILDFVDQVFADTDLAQKIGLKPHSPLKHFSSRQGDSGCVEIWPLRNTEKSSQSEEKAHWILPPVSLEEQDKKMRDGMGGTSLAQDIARTISGWLQSREEIRALGRRIEPKDILILVRTRTPFVGELIRYLKLFQVPVSGIDRMKLKDQIAVADCLALAKFARFPTDDLSFACLLRSPFIRISEEDLMNLALGRGVQSLWETFQKSGSSQTIDWLYHVIEEARLAKPFDFFDRILNGPCPQDPKGSGWKSFATLLGEDCLDSLEEFLGHILRLEEEGLSSCESLIVAFQKSELEIKRDQEESEKESHNQVRIMTVHASKGLEAPIVICPDTTSLPSKNRENRLIWIEEDQNPLPLWTSKTTEACLVYKEATAARFGHSEAEYMRLLYVALTRARDRLYVMGDTKRKKLSERSWYAAVLNAMNRTNGVVVSEDGKYRLETPQTNPIAPLEMRQATDRAEFTRPTWLFARPTLNENLDVIRQIQPSRIAEKVLAPDALENQGFRFRRGNLMHRLFQYLPDIPDDRRSASIHQYLNKMADDLPVAARHQIHDEIMRILQDPVFADVFGPSSMAEVPFAGPLAEKLHIQGQIDRLVIKENEILIIDYKTNRPSPSSPEAIPDAYRAQLKAYKDALALIYPGHRINCALLWTDRPLLMPVLV